MAECVKARGIVIRKTKLGESDLIVSLLAHDGSLFQVVAKGARKPRSTFSSRLELFSEVHVMCAKGKGLPIAQEVQLDQAFPYLRTDYEKAACASVVAELLCRVAQDDLPVPRLFELSQASFQWIAQAEGIAPFALTAATVLKVLALCGFRPSFTRCVVCGASANHADARATSGNAPALVHVSYLDGGYVCPACAPQADTVNMDAYQVQWLNAFLMSTFPEIATFSPSADTVVGSLQFGQMWCKYHIGSRLKSIPILLNSALMSGNDV